MKVYCLPGMCVNCRVFDKITLPEGYEKTYIEWLPPSEAPFEEYVRQMAAPIDTSEPFILVGYSMGGVIMQEMNRFLQPRKNILISSIKQKEEIPSLFHLAKRTRINKNIPQQMYQVNSRVTHWFAQLMLSMTEEEIEQCLAYTSADYLKWAIYHITEWEPKGDCPNLYHIHGTDDLIFPFKQVQNPFAVEEGNHMMILRKAEEISRIIAQIL